MKRQNVETSTHRGVVCERIASGEPDAKGAIDVLVSPDGKVISDSGNYVLDAEAARLILAAFAARGRDVVFDYEHHTLGGKYSSPDGKALAAGWIKALRYEPGRGLIASVEWTPGARELIRAREYAYPSPVLVVRKKDNKAIELHSVALTNDPAIQGMDALAAKHSSHEKEITMAEEPATTEGVEPAVWLGAIATELGIALEGLQGEAMYKAILEGIKTLKGGGESEGEGDGEDKEVAASARKGLGLSADAKVEAVTLAINGLKGSGDGLAKLRGELTAMRTQNAERDERDFFAPYEEKGVVDKEADAAFFKSIHSIYTTNPDDAKVVLEGRVARLPEEGKTTPPREGAGAGGKVDRKTLIATASKGFDELDKRTAALTDRAAQVDGALYQVGMGTLTDEERRTLVA